MFSKPRHSVTVLAAALLLSGASTACMATARPAAGVVYVGEAPPRAIREARPSAPSRAHVWIPGHYEYRGRSYAWVSGRWEVPIAANYRRWIPGKWERNRNGWFWVDGRWR
jgi:hypothetical protein